MSVKHIKEYYEQISDQYQEMIENLKDAEQMLEDNIVDVDYVENLKKIIAPLKDNFERWTYMIFLLNQPERPAKEKKYISQNKKLLNSISKNNTLQATLDENTEVLQATEIKKSL